MRLSRLVVLSAALIASASCGISDAPTGASVATGTARIAVAPSFSQGAVQAYSVLSQMGIDVTNVHVVLTAADGSTRDTVVAFPVGQETLSIELLVPGRSAGQTFTVDVELRAADNTVLFHGREGVVAQSPLPGSTSGGPAPAPITITYTGPGATIRAVAVTPATSAVVGVQNITATATATDQNNANVSDVLVQWTTTDATIATVTATGSATATIATTGKRGSATIKATSPTGITGNATVTVIPVVTKLVVVSGGGQSALAGSSLPQPFIVEAQAADNLPVGGVPIAFRSVTAGGSVGSATATGDATTGRASTTMKLGATAGPYVFEASSGSLSPVTISQTATAPPIASIELVSGSGQVGTVGTLLPQLLTARVLDTFGNVVNNATVSWARASGGGSLASATTTTNESGVTTNGYTLGTIAASEAVTASITTASGSVVSVTFTARGNPGPPAVLASAGGGQRAQVNTAFPSQLFVRVTDQYGNGTPGVGVFWLVSGNTSTTASFSPSSSITDASGNAVTRVTAGGTPGALTVTAVAGSLSASFSETIDPAPQTGNPGTLSGFVYNAVSNAPLPGVTITVSQGESVVGTASTNASGNFVTPSLSAGSYTVTLSATGYVTATIVGQFISGNTQAQAVPLVPSSSDPGSISGTVQSATTGQAITGTPVTVELRAGLNNLTGTPLQSVTTNASGQYIFANVTAGTYTVLAQATGYTTGSKTGISVGSTTTSNQNIVISPTGAAGNVRIVATWLAHPRDLDSYLSGPIANTSNRFLVWYGDKGNCQSSPFACLDVDVTGGNGPETVTISQPIEGTYRYSLRNYSQETPLSQSGAQVQLYIDNVLVRSFSIPSGSGTVWTVFELNGSTVTTINALTDVYPTSGIAGSRVAPSSSAHSDVTLIEAATRARPKAGPTPR